MLRERLIVDVDAFGTDMSLTAEQLQRIRMRGRGLDADGHVLLDARYASRADADLDEVVVLRPVPAHPWPGPATERVGAAAAGDAADRGRR